MVNCKVCEIEVPPRRTYCRSICEACQKFFRRYYPKRYELECTYGTQNCAVHYKTRRSCLRCRIEKAIAVGMRSKHPPPKATADDQSSCSYRHSTTADTPFWESLQPSTSNSTGLSLESFRGAASIQFTADKVFRESKENSLVKNHPDAEASISCYLPLVRDPTIFDGNGIESAVRNAASAYTFLHNYEFSFLRRSTAPFGNIQDCIAKLMQHMADGIRTGMGYANYFLESEGLQISPVTLFESGAIRQLGWLYFALPTAGDFTFFGVDKSNIPYLEEHIPELRGHLAMEQELYDDLARWNPPFMICTIMFGLLLLNDQVANDERASRVRQRLWLALDLVTAKIANGNSLTTWELKENCARCLRKTHVSASKGIQINLALAQRNPVTAPAISVITSPETALSNSM